MATKADLQEDLALMLVEERKLREEVAQLKAKLAAIRAIMES